MGVIYNVNQDERRWTRWELYKFMAKADPIGAVIVGIAILVLLIGWGVTGWIAWVLWNK